MAGSRCAVFGRVNHESRVTAARHARNADDDIGGDRGNRIGKQQQHCLDTDDTDEYGHAGSGSSLEGIMILPI